ncbi:MAG: AEC family transporter [Lachnospiraceae bacterium]|nr:AEC family transporter [Lachnospiraceae bacterium]
MENFIFSLNATIPIFLLIILGWFLMQIGLFNREFTAVADKYVFKIALPLLLFKDIATANIREVFSLKFVLFCSIGTTLMFLGVWLFARWYCKDKSMVGAFAQAAARGSAAILGIAFVENIYGNSGMAPMMIVSAVPLYNIFSVVILTFGAEEAEGENMSATIKRAFVNVIKNPIIIGILAGAIFALLNIPIPTIPARAITNIANTASPIALLVVGATFEGRKALAKIKPSLVATLIKLVIIPAIFFPFAILFGFRNSELVAILVMLGSPTTVSCYIMAKNMHNDAVLTSSVVVLATLISSVTLTMWIFLLKSFALI